ncbi:MAG: flagellar hook-basal body complex protein FliE [Deltaproteobacteria bacterium]|nr:flagellar hook-basal body complex protein FliE [Deltaproteobacteria bacterium]
MRINPFEAGASLSINPKANPPKAEQAFVDTLKEAINATDDIIKDANKASLELASGKATNIHEAMIKMQKADITLRLLVSSANKLIEGYNELMRLR